MPSATNLPQKARAQGLHDLLVFTTTATSSFASGLLLKANGWDMLNYVAMPFLLMAGVSTLWLLMSGRRRATGASG